MSVCIIWISDIWIIIVVSNCCFNNVCASLEFFNTGANKIEL